MDTTKFTATTVKMCDCPHEEKLKPPSTPSQVSEVVMDTTKSTVTIEEKLNPPSTPSQVSEIVIDTTKSTDTTVKKCLCPHEQKLDPPITPSQVSEIVVVNPEVSVIRVDISKEDNKPLPRQVEERKCHQRGCMEIFFITCSILLCILFPFSLCFCFRVVQQYERAVMFRLGRLRCGEPKGPGMIFFLPCIDELCKVDLRTMSFNVATQEVLTRDSVSVTVDAVVFYRVEDPLKATISVYQYSNATRLLAATTLRNILGTHTLLEILSDREAIAYNMQVCLIEATIQWGIKVERVEFKDVVLPQQLQRAMATEAEAAREARAKVIASEGELKASRALKEASDVLTASPAALQLRYLQTLVSIASEKNSLIIFPLPTDLIRLFWKKN